MKNRKIRIPKGKGFYYAVSSDALREYARLNAWSKLRWLLLANRFIETAASPATKRLHEKFREGSI
ncbi:MAG: hypothetical protein AABZ44_01765 [Elusimicrobiota bacterium]